MQPEASAPSPSSPTESPKPTQLPIVPEAASDAAALAPPPEEGYFVEDGEIVSRTFGRNGELCEVVLANFVARIVEHVIVDDGNEQASHFKIEAIVDGVTETFAVPAKQFASLTWIEEKLGPRAIVAAGYQLRDQLRAAIQHVSDDIKRTITYRHVGWREIDGQSVYLTAEGAIGASGPVASVMVEPPEALRLLAFPTPGTPEQTRADVAASLSLLRLGPPRVIYPLYAGVWRSFLGSPDFALALVGKSGEFKTATAAVMQQHFGPRFDHAHLPGNWASTANALEETLFLAKDMLAVVDDYAPQSSPDAARALQSVASRIFRSVGNRQGRQRMRADTSVRAARPPRGLLISTGEDLPPGQSIRARVLIIDVDKGDISKDLLTQAQHHAADGVYARAAGAFVGWLAPCIKVIQAAWPQRIEDLASQLPTVNGHRRTHRIVCELLSAFWIFLEFAKEVGAISEADEAAHYNAARLAILDAAEHQAEYQQKADPAETFIETLSACLVSGFAHLYPVDGLPPEPPTAFGWQMTGSGLRASGSRVGWLADEGVYLEPTAALNAVRRMDPAAINVTPETLSKRLHEGGHLASTESRGGRTRFKVRKTIDGVRREVLHVRIESLVGEPDDGGAPDPAPTGGSGKPPSGPSELVAGTPPAGDDRPISPFMPPPSGHPNHQSTKEST